MQLASFFCLALLPTIVLGADESPESSSVALNWARTGKAECEWGATFTSPKCKHARFKAVPRDEIGKEFKIASHTNYLGNRLKNAYSLVSLPSVMVVLENQTGEDMRLEHYESPHGDFTIQPPSTLRNNYMTVFFVQSRNAHGVTSLVKVHKGTQFFFVYRVGAGRSRPLYFHVVLDFRHIKSSMFGPQFHPIMFFDETKRDFDYVTKQESFYRRYIPKKSDDNKHYSASGNVDSGEFQADFHLQTLDADNIDRVRTHDADFRLGIVVSGEYDPGNANAEDIRFRQEIDRKITRNEKDIVQLEQLAVDNEKKRLQCEERHGVICDKMERLLTANNIQRRTKVPTRRRPLDIQ